jgi:hypothetical protein
MEETAVEWLYNNLKSHFEHDGDLLEAVQISFNIAKEMEMQQIIDAYDVQWKYEVKNGEDYYNKQFKK